ncbi:transmembrane protein adipocyte-associated 1 homolog [Eurytemora carolleeae]|uniref:transmembrane protein adipocyte-associated 1 homolog n=1 Tax=Eurytemora carolleeae TaxID=1294199 RepID=UPI000C75E93D|nr:transmembrane protein adipocyte-associated 1 homolog [Eurytemora carolleeae]XP_023338847.1 transmembrane protein adipocyte-associated 1 homolog [Eurytemora carolleeae]|eukprot:XP_023338846.1 transmembrane protein adipocyte-associated 1 homolog [Eurytemora affinis]
MDGIVNVLQDVLRGSNSSDKDLGEEVFDHDEFFHQQNKDEVPVSEFYVCKKILYTTIGVSSVKVFDVCLLVPAILFLLLLIYTSPRSRQKLSGAPAFVVFLQFITLASTAICLGRALLLIMVPAHKDSSNTLDKVSWTLTRSSLLCLELTAILNLMFASLPSSRNSRRLLFGVVLVSIAFFIITLLIELGVPSAAFHVFGLGYYLYAEGGGLYTAIIAGTLAVLNTIVILVRLRQHKSSPGRSKALIYSSILLGLNSSRALGGVVLLTGMKGGICLTSLTLYLHTVLVGPLVFLFILSPYLRHGQGHSLLHYSTQVNEEWTDEDISCEEKSGSGILRNENHEQSEYTDPELLGENEDDY